jgi:hypothetical protein
MSVQVQSAMLEAHFIGTKKARQKGLHPSRGRSRSADKVKRSASDFSRAGADTVNKRDIDDRGKCLSEKLSRIQLPLPVRSLNALNVRCRTTVILAPLRLSVRLGLLHMSSRSLPICQCMTSFTSPC